MPCILFARSSSRGIIPAAIFIPAVIVLFLGSAAPSAPLPASNASAAAPDASDAASPNSGSLAAPDGKPIVLFSGHDDEVGRNWVRCGTGRSAGWPVRHGAMVATGGDICTRELFQDFSLHTEFMVPLMPKARGQARGNSGIKLQGVYEIQILDSYGIADPGTGDCGAVYSQAAPLVNACRPPGRWQTYDIVFHAPKFDPVTHGVMERGRVTVIQNGIVVQNNQEIRGVTGGRKANSLGETGPILLQYHGSPMEFRNIRIVPLPTRGALHY